MLNLGELAKRLERTLVNNSPLVLTAIGVTGTLTTALLTGRATYRYTRELAEEGFYDRDYKFERTAREHVEEAWKHYVPAAATAVITVAAVISANRIGTRRAAALAAAYSVTERAFEEYREKIVEHIGPKKEQSARDQIAQDRVNATPASSKEVIFTDGGSVLCFEAFTGRYFLSDMETLRRAQNDINHRIIQDSYASLGDFYNLVGLPATSNSEEVGWNLDKLLELNFSTTLSEAGRPCISVDFDVVPTRYNRL